MRVNAKFRKLSTSMFFFISPYLLMKVQTHSLGYHFLLYEDSNIVVSIPYIFFMRNVWVPSTQSVAICLVKVWVGSSAMQGHTCKNPKLGALLTHNNRSTLYFRTGNTRNYG